MTSSLPVLRGQKSESYMTGDGRSSTFAKILAGVVKYGVQPRTKK